MDHEITPPTAPTLNVSPYGFRLWAKEFYECYRCYRSFERTSDFSPVPYFLLCRAIELQFKAFHLAALGQSAVKNTGKSAVDVVKEYKHHLTKSYNDLPATLRTLSTEEFRLLKKANRIYSGKGFEYFNVGHAGRGFSNFPDLYALDALATKIIEWPDPDEGA